MPAAGPRDAGDALDVRRALRTRECWNHNTHYHRHLPRWAPPPWRRVLDVGCGEGLLTRRLAPFASEVVGIDADAGMIERARALAPDLLYHHGDALTTDVGTGFDLVTCVATLHHLGLSPGLTRLRGLVAPGGALVVVGMARAAAPVDWLWGGLGAAADAPARWARGHWEPEAPVRPPAETYADVMAEAARVLPGARFAYRLYWRYSLVWRAPVNA